MIELRKISEENFEECMSLEPKEEQKGFVASNLKSLAEAYIALANDSCIPMPYAIYNDNTMVGFLMLSFNAENNTKDENQYWLCRFMIDKNHQRKGYGKESLLKALAMIKEFSLNKKAAVYLSYEPENDIARKLYRTLGFQETGEVEEGEVVAKLCL